MGCDAVVFAKNSKKYYYFDRLYNLSAHSQMWGCEDEHYNDVFERLFGYGSQKKSEVTQEELTYLCQKTAEFWKQEEGSEGRAEWCENIIEFAKSHPGDSYFVMDDYEQPDYHDVAAEGGYIQWETPKEIEASEELQKRRKMCTCVSEPGKCWVHNTMKSEDIQAFQKVLEACPHPKDMIHGGVLKVESIDEVLKKLKY